jgi:hypothetical protein
LFAATQEFPLEASVPDHVVITPLAPRMIGINGMISHGFIMGSSMIFAPPEATKR